MTDVPEELVYGGDCTLHYHSADRRVTPQMLASIKSGERTRTVSSNTTLMATDDFVLVDTSTGTVIVGLPAAVSGQRLTIIKKVAANSVTINRAGSDQILVLGVLSNTTSLSSAGAVIRLKAFAGGLWVPY